MENKLRFVREEVSRIEAARDAVISKTEETKKILELLGAEKRDIDSQLRVARHYLLLIEAIGEMVLNARANVLRLRGHQDGDHTSVALKLQEATNFLQGLCGHQFVVGYPSFRGMACENYYDGYSGRRMCVVCGLEESPHNTYPKDSYKILVESPSRLIARHKGFGPSEFFTDRDGYEQSRCRWVAGGRPASLDIWRPLEGLLVIFEEGIGTSLEGH